MTTPDESSMTLHQAVTVIADDLAETQARMEPDTGAWVEAQWDGMDDEPPTVRVDRDAAYVLLAHAQGDPPASVVAVADDLARIAYHLELLAGRGGYDALRPTLELAVRLREDQDVLDPAVRDRCPGCGRMVRVDAFPELRAAWEFSGGAEPHTDQGGEHCRGVAK